MFVTINVYFNVFARQEVSFLAKFIWSPTYVPKFPGRLGFIELSTLMIELNVKTYILALGFKQIIDIKRYTFRSFTLFRFAYFVWYSTKVIRTLFGHFPAVRDALKNDN